jgi:hypothetical protein
VNKKRTTSSLTASFASSIRTTCRGSPSSASLLHMRVVIGPVSYRVNRRRPAHAEIPHGGEAQETAESGERVDETIDDVRSRPGECSASASSTG